MNAYTHFLRTYFVCIVYTIFNVEYVFMKSVCFENLAMHRTYFLRICTFACTHFLRINPVRVNTKAFTWKLQPKIWDKRQSYGIINYWFIEKVRSDNQKSGFCSSLRTRDSWDWQSEHKASKWSLHDGLPQFWHTVCTFRTFRRFPPKSGPEIWVTQWTQRFWSVGVMSWFFETVALAGTGGSELPTAELPTGWPRTRAILYRIA